MKRKSRLVIFALSLFFQLTASQPSPAGTLYPIAISGKPAPDGNGVFATFRAPVLNNRGVVCFHSSLEDYTGSSAYHGIYCGVPGQVARVARGGQSPGVLGGGQFQDSNFQSGSINDAGQVAFKLGVSANMGLTSSAVFRKGATRDGFSMLARTADAAPGEGVFSSLNQPDWRPVLGPGGHVAFYANLAGTNGGTADDSGIFRSNASGDVVARIVQEGDILPGVPQTLRGFSRVNPVDASGRLAFLSLLDGSQYEAACVGSATTLEIVARKGDVVPGLGTISHIVSDGLMIGGFGEVAFAASTDAGSGAEGIVRGSGPGTFVTVAAIGQSIPGTGRKFYSSFSSNVYLNRIGQVAFECATTTEAGGDLRIGLFRDHTLIAQEGQNVPGEAETISGFGGEGFALNDFTDMAFLSRLNGGGKCLFVHDVGGLQKVAKTGDAFLGSTITDLDFAGRTASEFLPLGMHGFNDQREVAFRFTLADERQGIALWSSLPKQTGGAGIVEKLIDGFRVRIPGIPGWDYVMERDADLVPPWEDLPEPIRAGPDGWVTFDDLGPGLPPRRFYRCREAN